MFEESNLQAGAQSTVAEFAADPAAVTAVVMDGRDMHPLIEAELKRFAKVYKKSSPNLLRRPDYVRWPAVLDMMPSGGAVLDVGVGAGQFVSALKASAGFERVEGLDVKPHGKFLPRDKDPVKMTYASATDMPYADGEFDVVTCLEVIEHLETSAMNAALAELRRVAGRELIITVPYCEQEPLPTYHKQRYDLARLRELFPDGEVVLMVNERKVRWALVRERYQRTGHGS
ncbi:MAG: hypothetical protein HLUCCA04_04135 [Oceanicaulis sp. HLUCCA04]|nr:MAG: hypothetical protein HLUCCA04_04135 [Oceanicaulis sp. HLUCCA04]